MGWVESFGPPRFVQENFFKVFPRDRRTEEMHIAIAAFSLAAEPRPEPARSLTVLATRLIQRQNRFASVSLISVL
jgi:hypothetical protein